MARTGKKKATEDKKSEEFVMPSEEPISSKKYLTELELKDLTAFNDKVTISKLNSEVLALKIRNTELTIQDMQDYLASLKVNLRKSGEAEKASKENARQNMVNIQSKYSIAGNFAFDPVSGELITE